MNAFANIQVRVYTAAAQAQLKAMQAQLAALDKTAMGAGAAGAAMGKQFQYGLPLLSKWGNQIQWAGRQLQYNFTLPILLATGAATKFALDNEKAMTRVTKVYGDNTPVFNRLAKTEIPALEKAFEALSNRFGVARKDVINIAGDWAAAGASGIALAKGVGLTLQTMVLGEMDAAEATQSLIAIQAQYGQNTEQLSKTIDTLNMIENQTGISMGGLIQGFARAAGVARSAGIDVSHLGAMLAALTPSAGSAAQAGNGLKTMISRLLAPTKEARDVLALMGINVDDVGWKSLNGAQRLETLAKAYEGLSKGVKSNVKELDNNGKATGRMLSAQQAVVSSVIASRYQINRFDVLMRDITNKNGYYQKSLNATADAQRNFSQKVKELNIVLNSNPQRLKQMWIILQNALADVIQPMLPYIVWLASEVAHLARWFQGLDPMVQKVALSMLLLLAAVGPVARYIGSFMLLGGMLSKVMHMLAAAFFTVGGTILAMFMTPLSLAGRALMATITIFSGFGTRLVVLVGSIVLRMNAIWIGLGAIPTFAMFVWSSTLKIFQAAVALLPVIMGRMRIIVGTMALTLGAVQAAASVGLARVMMVFITFGARLPVIMGTAQAVLAGLWTTFTEFMVFAGTVMRAGLMAVWTTMYVRLAAITAAGSTLISGLWTRLSGGLYNLMMATSAGIVRLWTIMWTMMSRVSIAGMLGMMKNILRFGRLLISPWAILAAAIIGILYAMRNKIAQAWNGVVHYFQSSNGLVARAMQGLVGIFNGAVNVIESAFWKLPGGVRNALLAVVRIVQQAAMAVYNLFSYLNPWAHHSPSLVESVTSGMDEIQRQYARASSIGDLFSKVASDLAKFKAIAATMGKGPWQQERQDVAKNYAKALPVFDALVSDWKQLNALLDKQDAKVKAQQAVVDKWKSSLDAANAALDKQQNSLDILQDKLGALNDLYQQHQDALNNFASAPLVGMKAMNEQIFQNEMAQKQLQLQMMKWEDVNGSIEDVRNQYEALQGDIETMKGQVADLRSAGAGSDITGPMEQQIASMQAQASALNQAVQDSPLTQWQKQLDALQRQAQEMDLEKSLQFDPLTHQIENLVNTTKELTFQEVVDGITNEQNAMAGLQPQIDSLTAAIANQQAAVNAAKLARDQIQGSYDAEDAKLQKLQDEYQKTKDAISDVEQALRDMASAATDANKAASKVHGPKKGGGGGGSGPGAANFAGAAGGGFPDVGSMSKIGREGGLGDQSKMIDQFTQDLNSQVGQMFGKINMVAPLKEKWNAAVGWLKEHVGPDMSAIGDGIASGLGSIKNPFTGDSGFAKGFNNLKDTVFKIVGDIVTGVQNLFKLFAPDLERIWNAITESASKAFNEIGPEVAKFGDLWDNLAPALKNFWAILKPVVAFLGGVLLVVIKLLVSVFAGVLGPVLKTVIAIIGDTIQIIRGFAEIIIGIFSGDLPTVIQGLKDVFSGTFQTIGDILDGAVRIIVGLVMGLVHGIVDLFKWLYDILVGHSIVPDLVNGIITAFQLLFVVPIWLWNNVIHPIFQHFKDIWDNYIKPFLSTWFDMIKGAWNSLTTLGGWVWNNIVKPIWDKFKDGMDNVKGAVNDAKEKVSTAFGVMKDKAGDVVDWLSNIPQKIKNLAGDFKDAGSHIIGKLWDGMRNAGSIIGDLAGDVWQHVKGFLNSGIDAINNAIPNSIGKGPLTVDLPDNPFPHFYKGGIVKGSRFGTPIVAGDRGHDEAIVPLSGPYAPKPDQSLPGGFGQKPGVTVNTFHFHGDLSFPNITDPADADTFIRNLEMMAKD